MLKISRTLLLLIISTATSLVSITITSCLNYCQRFLNWSPFLSLLSWSIFQIAAGAIILKHVSLRNSSIQNPPMASHLGVNSEVLSTACKVLLASCFLSELISYYPPFLTILHQQRYLCPSPDIPSSSHCPAFFFFLPVSLPNKPFP